MKPIVKLNDLLEEQLRDLFDGELQLSSFLSRLLELAADPKLKTIIKEYIECNEEQLMRLRQVFDLLYTQKRGEHCEAMHTLIEEAAEIVNRSKFDQIRDAGIITALQHIMHYKMAGYGAVSNYTSQLDLSNPGAILHTNLENEKQFDQRLAKIADAQVNVHAV